jgi:hypothetical protein
VKIRDYRFGHVVVEGQQETRDLIVLPRRVVRNWWRRDRRALVLEDLAESRPFGKRKRAQWTGPPSSSLDGVTS